MIFCCRVVKVRFNEIDNFCDRLFVFCSEKAKLLLTARECQQNYYEILSDWNRYELNDRGYLKDFIGYALVGPPNYREPKDGGGADDAHFSYDKKQCEAIDMIYDKVITYGHGEQSNGIILCGIVYNVIYNKEQSLNAKKKAEKDKKKLESKQEKTKDDVLKPEAQVYPVPVFRVRKYRSLVMTKEKEAAKVSDVEQIYYIDNAGRVYNGFSDYLQNNTLPKCTMVVPKDGRYQADPVLSKVTDFEKQNINDFVSSVWIEVHQSPASNMTSKVLLGGDIASTVVTLGCMGVGIAAMLTPVGAGVAAASMYQSHSNVFFIIQMLYLENIR